MDPLSDVLSLLKVQSVLSARFEGRGAWSMRFPPYRHIKFGGVLEGVFWLWIEGTTSPVRLEAGDFYLLTTGAAYCSATQPVLAPLDGRLIFDTHKEADGVVRYGAGDDKVTAAGGRLTFDDATADILLDQLPPLVHLPAASRGATPLPAILDLLASETNTLQPGSLISAASIANVVLVHVLRAHLASTPQPVGWLGALIDPRIGQALASMHGDLARRWTVADLAHACGMSRTSFAQRFKARVGVPPLDYLLRWRMAVAGALLKNSEKSIATVAASVGYASDTAFNSAFKRTIGESPGRHRISGRA
ncbi:MAG: AraC family transcriptional regulator [Janthinobacterium lividum]